MRRIHKEYEHHFLLEPTKLSRIVGTIQQRLADHTGATQHDKFEVFFAGNRREEMTTVDEVLALDNSRRNRIKRLLLTCSSSPLGASRPEHEVVVDFASPKTDSHSSGSSATVVAISVQSDAAGWASRTLSEVEEQVERTWLHHLPPLAALLAALFGLLLVVLVVLGSQVPSLGIGPRSDTMWLKNADLDRIEAMLGQERALTDAELREVSAMQLRNILEARGPKPSPQANKRALFLVVPLIAVVACIIALIATCYPRVVFLWGDEVERYSSTLQRRKTIWGIIIAVAIVGVLSRLFFEGLMSWLPPDL